MGMSTHVTAWREPSLKAAKMAAARAACEAAGVPEPKEVTAFFVTEGGAEIDEQTLRKCGAAANWSGDGASGIEVFLDKLPPGVKMVRFYNSW